VNEEDSGRWQRLSEHVNALMARTQVPGVALGLLHEDAIQTAGFGLTSVENPLPVTGETLFQIGSITKTFVGTAVMRLVERDQIELDATVRSHLAHFRVRDADASARATIRHLLTHMGGWAGDLFRDTGSGDDALARYVADMAELPQLAPLNTHWSYNNAGFSLLGRILEVVTGQTCEQAIRDLVLDPLDMAHAFFEPAQVMTHRFAVGHQIGADGPAVARPWPLARAAHPAGGLTCSVLDLMQYARLHLGQDSAASAQPLLSAESLAAMQSPQATLWRDKAAWGLAWGIEEVDGARVVAHGGGTNGQISQLALVPARRFALALLTNANRGSALIRKVRDWVLAEYLGLEVRSPEPLEAPPGELAAYAGVYRGYFTDLELGVLGGRLVGQVTYKRGFPDQDAPIQPPPPPAALALCEEDRLLILDGPAKDGLVDIIRQPDGAIGWLRFGGRLHTRQP
jgi:CubicO group peptidase (beta-lactamase class C family)